MPRDDLSIDWIGHRMPPAEHQDAAAVLDDFVNRVANLPAEIQFMQDEIADKERQIQTSLDAINSRDVSIQKWVRLNTALVPNPKEEQLRKVCIENYDRIQILQEEKCALAQKSQQAIDRHIRYLDGQIKALQDRGDFPSDPDLPSLLRSSPADRTVGRTTTTTTSTPLTQIHNSSTVTHVGIPRHITQPAGPQRMTPVQTQTQQVSSGMSASAPATPAAALLLNRQVRESSAGATNKRPRLTGTQSSVPTTSSSLARHSSIGPATPKASTPTATRAGSAGPRTQKAIKKVAPHKVGTLARKGKPGKSGLSRVKRTLNKNSPSSTNDSELSEAESGSIDDDDAVTPPPAARDGEGDEDMLDAEDEEGGDDRKYCTCQSVSYGDMVACDNDNCPFEWFHWTCVGLKSEPQGTWICPVCTENMKKKKQ